MKAVYSSAILAVFGLVSAASAQQEATVTLDAKKIVLKYESPAGKTRAAASFHCDADLAFKGISVPQGDYTVYVLADGPQWQLAVNKATGAKAATYDPKLDLGRVAMTMAKPANAVNGYKMAMTKTAVIAAKIEVTWNGAVGAAPFHIDRGGSDSEW